ncbi:hypothetical protein [Nocardia sp. alder85J]|uniref:hypothetical protein n=1 Tax=Nocardia sp. alder85J TaxID=2862949 RepID=UPI001CD645A9|nr:hypothetical protein [Nocardia sp. alder85J]MCX4097680.1 hypothetical protein [Nocardia sp. alder85J]
MSHTGDQPALPLRTKLDRLFEFGRSRDEPERSTADVAGTVSQLLGRIVDPEIIDSARSGDLLDLPAEIADALADVFAVDAMYLRETGEEVTRYDLVLQVCILIRDRGLRVAFRAFNLDTVALQELVALIENECPVPQTAAGSAARHHDLTAFP